MNSEFGKALAIITVDQPWPQPTSATLPPRLSFSTAPSRAGSHAPIQLVVVAGARHRAKHAPSLLAPRDPAASAERRLDLGLVVEHRGHQVEAAQQIN